MLFTRCVEYECKLNKHGKLRLTSSHVVHASKSFGLEKRTTIALQDISDLTRAGPMIISVIVKGGSKYQYMRVCAEQWQHARPT